MNSTSKLSIRKILKTIEQIYSIEDPTILKEKKIKHSTNFEKKRE